VVEKKIIAHCLKDTTAVIQGIQRGMKPEYFSMPEYGTMYKVLLWFQKNYKQVPTLDSLKSTIAQSNLSAKLQISLPVVYAECGQLPTDEPIEFLYDLLIKEYKSRTVRNTLAGVVDDLQANQIDKVIASVKSQLTRLELLGISDSKEGDLRDSVDERIDEYFDVKLNPKVGIHTGYPTIDYYTGGMQAGELWVILGFMKAGKSALLLNMANHAWLKEHKNVLFVSAEVRKRVLERRLDALNTGLSYRALKRGALTTVEEQVFKDTLTRYKNENSSFYILDEAGISVSSIAAKVEELKSITPIDLVVADYIGILTPDSPSKQGQQHIDIGNIALGLRHIARREEIPVLTAHQFNRDGGRRGQAHATQIAGSIDIGKHADLVMSIKVHDEDEKEQSPVCVLDGKIMLSRDSATTSFELEACFDKMIITEPLRVQ
jgi:replicative DNA helicase